MRQLVEMDTRFWEVFDAGGKSLGFFMYGDMIKQFSVCGNGVLHQAFTWLKHINHTYKVVGNIYPLDEDSPIPIIQERKIKERKKERERDKKYAKKKGFKLTDKITFGKHKDKTIRQIIDGYKGYFDWMLKNNIILLHPEVEIFVSESSPKS